MRRPLTRDTRELDIILHGRPGTSEGATAGKCSGVMALRKDVLERSWRIESGDVSSNI